MVFSALFPFDSRFRNVSKHFSTHWKRPITLVRWSTVNVAVLQKAKLRGRTPLAGPAAVRKMSSFLKLQGQGSPCVYPHIFLQLNQQYLTYIPCVVKPNMDLLGSSLNIKPVCPAVSICLCRPSTEIRKVAVSIGRCRIQQRICLHRVGHSDLSIQHGRNDIISPSVKKPGRKSIRCLSQNS